MGQAKLPNLLELKHDALNGAVAELGSAAKIKDVFIGVQEHLYAPQDG